MTIKLKKQQGGLALKGNKVLFLEELQQLSMDIRKALNRDSMSI